jgi:hypothetical protein
MKDLCNDGEDANERASGGEKVARVLLRMFIFYVKTGLSTLSFYGKVATSTPPPPPTSPPLLSVMFTDVH